MKCTALLRRASTAFSLVELVVSMAVLLVIMLLLTQATDSMLKLWRDSDERISSFQGARAAFERIGTSLEQATLQPYFDYVNASGDTRSQHAATASGTPFRPVRYARMSELHFLAGHSANLIPEGSRTLTPGHTVLFQAPLGNTEITSYRKLDHLLNSAGFYVEFGDDSPNWPDFIQNLASDAQGHAYRLVEWTQPAELLDVYNQTARPDYSRDWFSDTFLAPPSTAASNLQTAPRVIAEHVPLLVFLPKLARGEEAKLEGVAYQENLAGTYLCPNYEYDSRAWQQGYPGNISGNLGGIPRTQLMRNQLPPLIDVVMIVVDSRDARRLQTGTTPPAELAVPASLFQNAQQNAENLFEQDLDTYVQQLIDASINFRMFRTTVTLKGAKWSNES